MSSGYCPHGVWVGGMGIDWPMTKAELNEAIPPAYTEFVGRQLVEHLRWPDVPEPDGYRIRDGGRVVPTLF